MVVWKSNRSPVMGALLLAMACGLASGQMTPEEHASHHAAASTPDQTVQPAPGMPAAMSPPAVPSAPGSPAPASTVPAGGMMMSPADMLKMMQPACCGAASNNPLFPALMALPPLSATERARVEQLARDRMTQGTEMLSHGLDQLATSTAANDYPAMQAASAHMREGMDGFQSGLAAERALQENQNPQVVALRWFRTELNLPDQNGPQPGLSVFHWFIMLVLTIFAVVMIWLYFNKMRRAAALFGRFDPDKGPGSDGPPSPPGVPPPPAPRAPTSSESSSADSQSPATTTTSAAPSQPAPPVTGGSSSLPSAAAAEATSTAAVTANWRGRLHVASIVMETPTVKTFRLVSSTNNRYLPFTFLPGQFLNVAFWIGGAKMNRSYSISSSPNEREFVELTIRREPRGAVSRHIDDLVKVGDLIDCGGPVGKFTFTGSEADSIVLLSGGVGVTPMMSISRYLTELSWPGDIYFVYSCSTPADLIFADKLPALQRLNPKLHLLITLSRPGGTDWKGARGRITKEWLTQVVPDLASRRCHLCGPPAMMDSVKAIFAELGIPPHHLKTEAFGAVKPVLAEAGTSAKPSTAATGPLVTFSKSGKSAKVRMDLQVGDSPPRQSILELSEELGIGIEFSCRVGTCGLCKVKMTSGEVDMEVQDALDDNDKAAGIILACQAKPTSDVVVVA
ncbi:FAD-binding oxidoreductase [soil metagenome]